MCAYVEALHGSDAVFFFGVVDKGTMLLQQHLDAVDRPGSGETAEKRGEAGGRKTPGRALRAPADPSPAEELVQHRVGDGRGQDSGPDRKQLPTRRTREEKYQDPEGKLSWYHGELTV